MIIESYEIARGKWDLALGEKVGKTEKIDQKESELSEPDVQVAKCM